MRKLFYGIRTQVGTAMQPYMNLALAVMGHKDVRPAIEEISALPLEKRYTWRVASALKWAFAGFENLNIVADRRTLGQEDLDTLVDLLRADGTVDVRVGANRSRPCERIAGRAWAGSRRSGKTDREASCLPRMTCSDCWHMSRRAIAPTAVIWGSSNNTNLAIPICGHIRPCPECVSPVEARTLPFCQPHL